MRRSVVRTLSLAAGAGAILVADQAKAIRMHFLRDLTKARLVEAFQEGFEANVKDRAAQKAAFDKMLALVPDVKEGTTLTFAYLPEKGTTLQAGNKELGVFEGEGLRRRGLRDLAGSQAALRGSEEGGCWAEGWGARSAHARASGNG